MELPLDARKYTDPDFDDTRISGQAGLWANILTISGVAFQVVLGLVGLRPELIDHEHILWLMNVCDYDSGLKPLAVTFATVKKGCAVCDESLVEGLLVEPWSSTLGESHLGGEDGPVSVEASECLPVVKE